MLRLFALILAALCFSSPALGAINAPTDVGNLVLWTDARDVNGTGIQPANGASVTTWTDKSGNGNHLTTASGTVTYEATGFDGVNPGLRFPLYARMAGPNPFAGIRQDEMTVFFVNANLSVTPNFSFNLNGTNPGTNTLNGRFSFHTPWVNNSVYFDAGGCCGATRLYGRLPHSALDTTLYTGLNDLGGRSQLLRIDGRAFRSDSTGLNANVSGGVHLGDLPSKYSYNGRFAEVVIYDRALTLPEIEDVECYLLLKWKPAAAPSHCSAKIEVQKTNAVWDPDALGLHAIPGNDMTYTIRATHGGGPNVDADTLFLVDSLPPEVTFFNGDADGPGPGTDAVNFTESGSGITFTPASDLRYSNTAAPPASLSDCTYTPNPGYDPNVRHVCLNPKGSFQSGTPSPYFELSFRTRIK